MIVKKILSHSTFLLIVIILFSFTLSGCGYGEKLTYLGNNELYYTSNVTKSEAEKLGNYLVKNGYFTNDTEIFMQLDKENRAYEIRMIMKTGLENDNDIIADLKYLCGDYSRNVFDNKYVDILLCDKNLKTIRTVVAD